MRTEIDGRTVFYGTGSGTPETGAQPIVFVHGAGFDHSIWVMPARYFARHGYQVIAPDLPAVAGQLTDLNRTGFFDQQVQGLVNQFLLRKCLSLAVGLIRETGTAGLTCPAARVRHGKWNQHLLRYLPRFSRPLA